MSAPLTPDRVGGMSDAEDASFQAVRPRLLGIAGRVLGGAEEAEDVVQDAWIRWQGADRSEVRDPATFLAATTRRLAINVVTSARARHAAHAHPGRPEPVDAADGPAALAEQRDALALALRLLLERLSPAERAAYLLRHAFDYRYRRIAEVLALSEANARQLVTRARGRLCGGPRRPAGAAEHRRLLDAFLAAARTGDLAPLERLLVADLLGGPDGGGVLLRAAA